MLMMLALTVGDASALCLKLVHMPLIGDNAKADAKMPNVACHLDGALLCRRFIEKVSKMLSLRGSGGNHLLLLSLK